MSPSEMGQAREDSLLGKLAGAVVESKRLQEDIPAAFGLELGSSERLGQQCAKVHRCSRAVRLAEPLQDES